jgi:ATP-dependent helicase/nuclease subunit A
MLVHQGRALWKTASGDAPTLLTQAQDAQKAAQEAERDRLLYVAMTRAEKWLIVAAAGDLGKDGSSWFHRVEAAMEVSGAVDHDFGFGGGLRLQSGDWALPLAETVSAENTETTPLEPFFHTPAPLADHPPETLSPSDDLGGAKALPGDAGLTEDAAKRRGSQIHLLLEGLPGVDPTLWSEKARVILSQGELRAMPEEADTLYYEARAVLSDPSLHHLFGPETLAEVAISASLDDLGGRRIHGVIDRLIIRPDHVVAVDFKTNAVVPPDIHACPEGILRQMGAYSAALSQIYPGRRIDTAILWTRTAALMPLPNDLVIQALRRSTLP